MRYEFIGERPEGDEHVALWLGNFASEIAFNEYMEWDKKFEKDFGIPKGFGEICLDNVSAFEAPIEHDVRTHFEWMSWSKEWIEEAIAAAQTKNIYRCNTVFGIHGYEYDAALDKSGPDAPMIFIGNFAYDYDADDTPIREE